MNKLSTINKIKVAVLAGRRIDALSAENTRFPLSNIGKVKKRLRQSFMYHDFTHLVCAAACGADLIALETATELNIKIHIILPFSPAEFRKLSVTDRPGDWGALYDRIINDAKKDNCLFLLGYSPDDKMAFSKTTSTLIDHAKEVADTTQPYSIVVWEGHSRGDDDETQAFATLSQEEGLHKVEILTL